MVEYKAGIRGAYTGNVIVEEKKFQRGRLRLGNFDQPRLFIGR